MDKLLEKPTQCAKVLKALKDANGGWVSGNYFLHTLYLSQFHARIWDLQNKHGVNIEASEDTDDYGFKKYRLPVEVKRLQLL